MRRDCWRFLARHDVLVVGILAGLACILLTYCKGLPIPFIHDEFSYLLAADTYRHGRWTNPPHPLWQHFEACHILQQPSYASKYPPAQGLFLALGWQLAGHPIVGVWLTVALACAAITWMSGQWLPRRWALLAGLLAVASLVFEGDVVEGKWPRGYWSRSYWGGAPAALGGALLLGAWRSWLRQPTAGRAVLGALGIVILATSRPFEGLVLCAGLFLATLATAARIPGGWLLVRRGILPALAVLIPSAGLLAYYNFQVTGDPLRLPYAEHMAQYDRVPVFLLQPLRPAPDWRHAALREHQTTFAESAYQRQQTWAGLRDEASMKLRLFWLMFLNTPVAIALIGLPCVLRSRWMCVALGLLLCVMLTVAFAETWGFAHYTAPAAGLVFLVLTQCLRHLSILRLHGWHVGRLVATLLVFTSLLQAAGRLRIEDRDTYSAWARYRVEFCEQLERQSGKHLVVVRYSDRHDAPEEWVYNGADIDAAKVVWAHEMGSAGRQRLLDYFHDRTPWLLLADEQPPRLVPFGTGDDEVSAIHR